MSGRDLRAENYKNEEMSFIVEKKIENESETKSDLKWIACIKE